MRRLLRSASCEFDSSVARDQKIRNLRRDNRAWVVLEGGSRPRLQGVTVAGPMEFLEADSEAGRALIEALLAKYHPDLEGRWGGRAMPPDRVLFRLLPGHVRGWGL